MPYLLAQEHHGGHLEHINPLDSAAPENVKAAVWALLIFLAVLFILWKFAWGPIVAGLQGREDRINASLKKAEDLERATREMTERHAEAMAKSQQDAQQIVADARAQAVKAASVVAAKAQEEIEASRDRFQREMSLEAARVKAEIRQEAVALTLAAAGRVVGKSLSGADHLRLAEEALRDAESTARN